MKVAICTSDGISVDLHFGKTSQFYIYAIENAQKTFLEKKEAITLSPSDDFLKESGENHDFEEEKFNSILSVLNGIDWLYTTSIGKVPEEKLREAGIKVKICNCPIELIPTCNGKCKG